MKYRYSKYELRFWCNKLNRYIYVVWDAVPHDVHGWICDCGNWYNPGDIMNHDTLDLQV
jgi:hypothetical protein